MEITAVKVPEATANYPIGGKGENSPVSQKNDSDNTKVKVQSENEDKKKDSKELSKDDVNKINGALNNFMDAINSDLHFVIHERSKELMLRVVDRRNSKVVKEIPTHEMLDVIATIRESVGALLDKRA